MGHLHIYHRMILLVGNGGIHLLTALCPTEQHLLQKDATMNLVKLQYVHAILTVVKVPGICLVMDITYIQRTPLITIISSISAPQKSSAVNLKVLIQIRQLVELLEKFPLRQKLSQPFNVILPSQYLENSAVRPWYRHPFFLQQIHLVGIGGLHQLMEFFRLV